MDRLTQASYASGTPTVLEYDGGTSPLPNDIGKLTRVTDEAGSTRFRYNGFGNVVSKTQTTAANGVAKDQTIAYAYGTSGSSTGHVISLTYPGSGNVVGYTYNSAGRIAGLTLTTANGSVALLSNIQYQPFGKPSGWTWGNGTAYTRSFDLSGRLTHFPLGATSGTGATPNGLSRTVNYDAASRITAYTHADTSGSTGSSTATAANQTFGYDDQDRLISYLPANSSQSYSYDANGNRTGQTIGGSSYTQTINANSNRQTASTGPTPTANSYDATGNQTGDGSTTYSYSDRGRLASVTKNGITTSYLYNGLEQRVVKSGTNVPSGATRYVYDEAGHLIGEYDQSGNAIQETVYLGDTPVVTIKNATPYYIYADQIDTPRVITDTSNLMVWRWDQTDPFGATLPDENPTSLGSFTYNLRFPGQLYDAETGKHYNANRDYDPASGRYVQSDPIGLNGGQWSTYSYVGSDPAGSIDPEGLAACTVLFPDYPIEYTEGKTSTWLGGHGGVVTYDSRGVTQYYEYGRYSPNSPGVIGARLPADDGNVRRVSVPNLKIGNDGQPTQASLDALSTALSQKAGHGTKTELSCNKNADEKKVNAYAQSVADDSNRQKYSWNPFSPNQCRTFSHRALDAGKAK